MKYSDIESVVEKIYYKIKFKWYLAHEFVNYVHLNLRQITRSIFVEIETLGDKNQGFYTFNYFW